VTRGSLLPVSFGLYGVMRWAALILRCLSHDWMSCAWRTC